jgi:hypothetical protein
VPDVRRIDATNHRPVHIGRVLVKVVRLQSAHTTTNPPSGVVVVVEMAAQSCMMSAHPSFGLSSAQGLLARHSVDYGSPLTTVVAAICPSTALAAWVSNGTRK